MTTSPLALWHMEKDVESEGQYIHYFKSQLTCTLYVAEYSIVYWLTGKLPVILKDSGLGRPNRAVLPTSKVNDTMLLSSMLDSLLPRGHCDVSELVSSTASRQKTK